ncbi:PQQ-binding-like beta-propeller repeat protein [Candidatus Pelagibacter sp.]|nr:PQQ-binding-like beta-propeller repeat protein [Candidatus Pelagibacter sp.]
MNNILKILLIFIFITSCSLSKNSKFWTKEKISVEKENKTIIVKEILKKEKVLNLEINPQSKISLYSKVVNKSFLNNFDNNNGRIDYRGNLKNISKFKFSKIKNFFQYDPKISFTNNNIIFFDNKGSILKFDNQSNLLWKKNYYSKSEKKLNPILNFANNRKILIVADSIARYYALDIKTGELIWSKNNSAPFNSQIKIYKNIFFIIDFENILRAYSLINGKEVWNIRTENTVIKSKKKLSLVIVNNKVYFNNSLGDITAVDIESGELVWQSPTQSNLVSSESFFLKTSDIIADNETLYFSNNKNQFFSMDIKTGTLNWKQKVNSNLRPTLIDDYIFTVSLEGYLTIINKNDGKIVRATDVFNNIKLKKRKKIKPTGFIVGKNDIYLSTDHGRLLIININNGTTTSMIKIVNKKISRPSVLNQNLFIVSDNSIIKLN